MPARLFLFLVSLLLALGAGAAPKSPDGRHLPPDIARIVARGELVVAMLGTDTPPFFYERDGELHGIEVDLARSIGRELGVKVRFDRSARTFNQVVDIVAAGDADLGISKLSRTLARMQAVRFSDPYLSLGHALILNRLSFAQLAGTRPLPEVVRDYRGTLGVIAKSSFADYARTNFPHAHVVEYPGWPEVMAALEKGDVTAAYRDEFEVKRVFRSNPKMALGFRSVTFKDLRDALGIAVNVNSATLLAFVNECLAQRGDKLTVQKVLDYREP
ncbi:MAG TPA: ABC transporter substrate-binding protein [Rhodocyclaceae bacterium]